LGVNEQKKGWKLLDKRVPKKAKTFWYFFVMGRRYANSNFLSRGDTLK